MNDFEEEMEDNDEEWRLQNEAEQSTGANPGETFDQEDTELYRLLFDSLAKMPEDPFVLVESAVMAQLARKEESRETRQFWVGAATVVVVVVALTAIVASTIGSSFTNWIFQFAASHWEIALFVGLLVGAIQVIDKRVRSIHA